MCIPCIHAAAIFEEQENKENDQWCSKYLENNVQFLLFFLEIDSFILKFSGKVAWSFENNFLSTSWTRATHFSLNFADCFKLLRHVHSPAICSCELPNFVNRWNTFRTYCGYEKKLKLALEVSCDLPSEEEINRWLGEPIGCAILKTKIFISNTSGYPVLSKPHQELVHKLLNRCIHIVISGVVREDTRPFYQQYINHLWQVGVSLRQ